jgi:hypothetical protein
VKIKITFHSIITPTDGEMTKELGLISLQTGKKWEVISSVALDPPEK